MAYNADDYKISEDSWKKYDTYESRGSQTNGITAGTTAVSAALAAKASTAIIASNLAAGGAASAAITGTTAAGSAAFTAAASSSVIPVVGWVIAAVAVAVGVGQVLSSVSERKVQQGIAENAEIIDKLLRADYELMLMIGQRRIDANHIRIKEIETRISYEKKTELVSASFLGIAGLLIAYEVYSKTK
tara:strand:+ start:57 stop:620 length:564 start_codon:yes stop_codon:yes gene_type:complete